MPGSVKWMPGTGDARLGVRRSLVLPDQMTDCILRCRQFAGDIVELAVARISLDSPVFKREVDACVIEDPVCDVMLWKIPGAQFQCTEIVGAVQTRAQAQAEVKPFRPLLTAKCLQLDVTLVHEGHHQS